MKYTTMICTYSPEVPKFLAIGDTIVYKDESGKYNQFGIVTDMDSRLRNWIWIDDTKMMSITEVRKCFPAVITTHPGYVTTHHNSLVIEYATI